MFDVFGILLVCGVDFELLNIGLLATFSGNVPFK